MSVTLKVSQIDELARTLSALRQVIVDYYCDPAHEEAFQRWYQERYGHAAPEGV